MILTNSIIALILLLVYIMCLCYSLNHKLEKTHPVRVAQFVSIQAVLMLIVVNTAVQGDYLFMYFTLVLALVLRVVREINN